MIFRGIFFLKAEDFQSNFDLLYQMCTQADQLCLQLIGDCVSNSNIFRISVFLNKFIPSIGGIYIFFAFSTFL